MSENIADLRIIQELTCIRHSVAFANHSSTLASRGRKDRKPRGNSFWWIGGNGMRSIRVKLDPKYNKNICWHQAHSQKRKKEPLQRKEHQPETSPNPPSIIVQHRSQPTNERPWRLYISGIQHHSLLWKWLISDRWTGWAPLRWRVDRLRQGGTRRLAGCRPCAPRCPSVYLDPRTLFHKRIRSAETNEWKGRQ